MKLLSYHDDPKIKRKYLARVRAHRKADQLVQGTGWEDGKGCAVGCTLNKYEHAAYEKELGVPIQLAHLEDAIFEGLPKADAMAWPERFLKAIPVGKDLSAVWPLFAVWMLRDLERDEKAADVKAAIGAVASCYERRAAGDDPTSDEWAMDAWAAWDAWDARAARAAKRAEFWNACADKLESLLVAS